MPKRRREPDVAAWHAPQVPPTIPIGWMTEPELFGPLPIAYHSKFKCYRCTLCGTGVRDVKDHFMSTGHHAGVFKASLKLFPAILDAYPEHDPYLFLPTTISPEEPSPHIPGIEITDGYRCDLCLTHYTHKQHAMRTHIRELHNTKCIPGAKSPYTACPNLQRFYMSKHFTAWFPSSPPDVLDAVAPPEMIGDPGSSHLPAAIPGPGRNIHMSALEANQVAPLLGNRHSVWHAVQLGPREKERLESLVGGPQDEVEDQYVLLRRQMRKTALDQPARTRKGNKMDVEQLTRRNLALEAENTALRHKVLALGRQAAISEGLGGSARGAGRSGVGARTRIMSQHDGDINPTPSSVESDPGIRTPTAAHLDGRPRHGPGMPQEEEYESEVEEEIEWRDDEKFEVESIDLPPLSQKRS